MNFTETIGRLLGYENVTSIDSIDFSFGSSWAHDGPAWVLFGCLGLCGLTGLFYARYQNRGRKRVRAALAFARAVVLCLLFVTLADPILQFTFTSHPRPLLWVLFDGTDSMAIEDELPEQQRERFAKAVDLDGYRAGLDDPSNQPIGTSEATTSEAASQGISRIDYVRALLSKKDDNLLRQLGEKYRLKAYVFDRDDGVRGVQLEGADDNETFDPTSMASLISTDGQVTALGNALDDLAIRHATSNLSGVLIVSDFDQNAGRAPIGPASKLGVPIYTLGVGPLSAVDLAVSIQAPLKMKKEELSTLSVTLRQQELDDQTVPVRVVAHRAGIAEEDRTPADSVVVGEKDVKLDGDTVTVEFPFTPKQTGRWVFTAEVAAQDGEIVDQNNTADREVAIIDDFMRLLFVEYEPTYEWRFVKEVFHRDKLVGMRGFRTYLRSSDPIVRETNELFLPTLTLPRREFFEYDVIFLSDMPGATLSTRFMAMTKEFVGQFGGGLVVMAGPRYGPGELADTPLADMLPVVLDPDARLEDRREFRPRLTPMAGQYPFMQLGGDEDENALAWDNLGRLPWFQPVKRVEARRSTVLIEHPTATCIDGKTPQPLMAIRKFGRGEVIYMGFNEMWRLRRKYGDKYYRQFWGQMIHRLGLSHALGSQKRFVVRTDRQQYKADDKVLLSVEAYNEDFEPLTEDDLAERALVAEVIRPGRTSDGKPNVEQIKITQFNDKGVFEARIPVFDGGEYRVRVKDPITKEDVEVHFEVTSLSAERRSAVRNIAVQQNIAASTGGRSYELDTVQAILNDFTPAQLTETTLEIFPLWSTWLCFTLIVAFLLIEWFVRKLVNLA